MRSVILSIVITVVTTVAFAAVANEVTGKWSLSVAAPGESVEVLLDLKQDGENVTGTMASSHGSGTISKGSYKDKKLSATITADIQGNPTELGLEGTVDGDKISGSLTATGLGTFPYSGSRSK